MRILWFKLTSWPSIYLAIVLLALAPVISAFSAEAIASALGCSLNEAGTDCPMGDVLGAMFVMGWLGVGTLPLGGVALVIAVLAHLGSIMMKNRREAQK
jgi:hypothetical protein